MIIDSLGGLERYLYLNPRFKKAFDFIRNQNLDELREGRYEIDGDAVYAVVTNEQAKGFEDSKLEVHDSYIDIQVAISGGETFGWRDRSLCGSVAAAYDENKDIAFFPDPADVFFTLESGNMVIFFPHDAHAPMIGEGLIRKMVIKVKV